MCIACPAGKFKSGVGEEACQDCTAGTYADSTGSSACSVCAINSTSMSSSAACTCNAGSTGPDGGPCTSCSAGKYSGARAGSFQYRFIVQRLRTSPNSCCVQMMEMRFFEESVPIGPQLSFLSIRNPGGDSPEENGVDQLIDGNVDTKWLDYNAKGGQTSMLVFTFEHPVNVCWIVRMGDR